MDKCVCVLEFENYTKNETYNCSVVKSGLLWVPLNKSSNIIIEEVFSPKNHSRYSITSINNHNYKSIKIENKYDEPKLTIVGYNVICANNSQHFDIDKFIKHFKSIKQIRKEKLKNLGL